MSYKFTYGGGRKGSFVKRARGKNSKTKVEELEVPEMLRKNQGQAVRKTTANKRPTKKKKKKNNHFKSFLVIVFALIVAFLIIMGMGWGSDSDDAGALIPVDMEKGKLNVLVLGVDKEGLRTDAMMLVSYDMKETTANIMSIPRDTQIKVKDRGVTRKINEVHAMHDKNNNMLGPMGSVKAVTALTGIPIHYYIEFSFDAIDEITDVLGPIEFDVPDVEGNGKGMNYDDPAQDLHIHLKPGLQKLKGNQVQQFLRYRKSNSGTGDGSDTKRVERQQEFIRAIVDQKVNLSLIAKMPTIYSKMKKNIKTNFSTGDIIKYSKYLNGLTSENIITHNLPGESKRTGSGWYYVCDLSETSALIASSFGYDGDNLSNVINVNDVDGTKKVLISEKKDDKQDIDEEPKEVEPLKEEKTETEPKKEQKESLNENIEEMEEEQPKQTTQEPEEEEVEQITQSEEIEDDVYINLD